MNGVLDMIWSDAEDVLSISNRVQTLWETRMVGVGLKEYIKVDFAWNVKEIKTYFFNHFQNQMRGKWKYYVIELINISFQ